MRAVGLRGLTAHWRVPTASLMFVGRGLCVKAMGMAVALGMGLRDRTRGDPAAEHGFCRRPYPVSPFLHKGRSMPTTKTSADACDLLDADHKAVKKMFKSYGELAQSKSREVGQKKMELAQQICLALTVHTQMEEEIFYPALRNVLKDTDLMAEAEVEHQAAKDLISQIQSMTEPDEMFDAKVRVLGEYIDHHVKEERNEIFPKARAARKLDLMRMREALETRKEALMIETTEVMA